MKHIFIFLWLLITSCLGANTCPLESWQEEAVYQWFYDNHDEHTTVTVVSWDFMTIHYPEKGNQFGVKTNETVEIRLTYQVRDGLTTTIHHRVFFICGRKIRDTRNIDRIPDFNDQLPSETHSHQRNDG